MKKKRKWFKLKVFVCLCLIFAAYVGISLYMSQYSLETTTYVYESDKIEEQVDIVVLTDIHNHLFGGKSEKLVSRIVEEQPDAICIVGDAINFYAEDDSFLKELVKKLVDIAPVYYTIGNHEEEQMSLTGNNIKNDVEALGAVYLDQDYVDITINNQAVRIGGLYEYSYNNRNLPLEQYHEKGSYKFLQEYEDTEAFKVILSHRPQSFITNDEDAKWDIDLVLCGHEHGGQIRIPFFGGFYSTHLGLFSEFLEGYHIVNGIPMVVSRGLATHFANKVPPRFNNVPEIVKISLR